MRYRCDAEFVIYYAKWNRHLLALSTYFRLVFVHKHQTHTTQWWKIGGAEVHTLAHKCQSTNVGRIQMYINLRWSPSHLFPWSLTFGIVPIIVVAVEAKFLVEKVWILLRKLFTLHSHWCFRRLYYILGSRHQFSTWSHSLHSNTYRPLQTIRSTE